MSQNKNSDIIALMHKIWINRKPIMRNCIIAAVVAVIVALSIPREYTSQVILAPESSQSNALSGLSPLASLAGVNLGGMSGGEDALYPELYPQIMSSTTFISELYDMTVQSSDMKIDTTLYYYIHKQQKFPWWGYIAMAPGKIKEIFSSKEQEHAKKEDVTYYSFSENEMSVINKLKNMVWVSVDVGNHVISIDVTMQDAKIAAQVADRVANLLQDYITRYRTQKAQRDLVYSQQLFGEARQEYYLKQSAYAKYVDQHALGSTKMQFKAEEERLQNEMELAFGLYNQVAQQLEISKAKVQERMLVYTVMQPAVVPLLPSAPRRMFILIGFVFLTFFANVGWLIIGSDVKRVWQKKESQG